MPSRNRAERWATPAQKSSLSASDRRSNTRSHLQSPEEDPDAAVSPPSAHCPAERVGSGEWTATKRLRADKRRQLAECPAPRPPAPNPFPSRPLPVHSVAHRDRG